MGNLLSPSTVLAPATPWLGGSGEVWLTVHPALSAIYYRDINCMPTVSLWLGNYTHSFILQTPFTHRRGLLVWLSSYFLKGN